MIAFDIGTHYIENFQGTGFKAQFAVDDARHRHPLPAVFKELGHIEAEVVISSPDTREGHESLEERGHLRRCNRFWKEMMERFGNEERYLKEILASFGREDGVEILIVIDKLLTGFDEPRNTVLYIDKPLKEHSILQAIARVNRIPPARSSVTSSTTAASSVV